MASINLQIEEEEEQPFISPQPAQIIGGFKQTKEKYKTQVEGYWGGEGGRGLASDWNLKSR